MHYVRNKLDLCYHATRRAAKQAIRDSQSQHRYRQGAFREGADDHYGDSPRLKQEPLVLRSVLCGKVTSSCGYTMSTGTVP
jgi:hypothetical protein